MMVARVSMGTSLSDPVEDHREAVEASKGDEAKA
jgi:hypothetical protein